MKYVILGYQLLPESYTVGVNENKSVKDVVRFFKRRMDIISRYLLFLLCMEKMVELIFLITREPLAFRKRQKSKAVTIIFVWK